MPSKKAYDLVSDDGYDSRIPLHNDEAFQHGLQFQAKYIGTLDVPRPSSRVEIVAAMRRIRYEFKAKAIKKKKVILTVSVEGVKVTLRKKKKSQWSLEESRLLVMHHPIYRIFYVSHDSQDLKIWSYIARDGPSNVFKCNVFKAYKKSQAMRIVRTIGQAFEVCHKLGGQSRPNSDIKEDVSDRSSEDNERRVSKSKESGSQEKKELNTPTKSVEVTKENHKPNPPNELSLKHTQQGLQAVPMKLSPPLGSPVMLGENADSGNGSGSDNNNSQLPLSQHHQMQLLRQQLEQQQHQTQVAIAQVHLLKDQLSAETAARIEAQARAHQLLLHNKDLLDHVSLLVTRVQQLEIKVTGVSPHSVESYHAPAQIPSLPDSTTPRPAPVYLPDMRSSNHYLDSDMMGGASTFANTKAAVLDADSPDSGHKEMSSESLSYSLNGGDANGWLNPYGPSSLSSSQDSGRNDSNGGWLTPTARSSSSPPSSSPSKSSTLKAGSTNSVDHQGTTANSVSHSSHPSPYASDPYVCRSPNFYKSSSESSPHKKEASDKIKLISPISSPQRSSSSQRMDFKPSPSPNNAYISTSFTSQPVSASSASSMTSSGGAAPKIDPPPKFRRTTRPIERWERGSWYGAPLAEHPGNFHSDSDYYSTYASSNNSNGVVLRSHNRNNSNSSSIATAGAFRYSDSSARSSLYSDNRDSTASIASLRQKLELRVNDLNSAAHHHQQQQQRQQNYQQQQHHHQQQQQQQMQQNGKWKMRLSYTSDENSDNSGDFTGPPSHGQGRENDRMESLRS